tara:strand:- start:244 stop:630 length:387 start_codon:yes stop_codon:yes gene_type:complete
VLDAPCQLMMESIFLENFEKSPLSREDINLIGSTSLSASQKHHLRMLLHCLECFKSMKKVNDKGGIPDKEIWLEWCLENPLMVEDDEFVQVLFEQFSGAALQLEKLSSALKIAPLHLTLRELIDSYEA